jgi:hypothetical protein
MHGNDQLVPVPAKALLGESAENDWKTQVCTA